MDDYSALAGRAPRSDFALLAASPLQSADGNLPIRLRSMYITDIRHFLNDKGDTVKASIAPDDAIVWSCPRGRTAGHISNWRRTLWDLSDPAQALRR